MCVNKKKLEHLNLANKVAEQFKSIASVEAITLAGSQSSKSMDEHSDVDIYVYSSENIPLVKRQSIVNHLGASKANLDLSFWDSGDEWVDLETDIEVDIIYWDKSWIEGEIDRNLVNYQAGMGYSTCFWYTVLNSIILFDRQGWFHQLQEKCNQPYPEQLKRAIICKNHPVLRNVIPSYYVQIQKAIDRHDLISVNHRLAALLASYFDVLFAVNGVLNPGEKKVLSFMLENCQKTTNNIEGQIEKMFQSAAIGDAALLNQLDKFLDGLDVLLIDEGIDPALTLTLGEENK